MGFLRSIIRISWTKIKIFWTFSITEIFFSCTTILENEYKGGVMRRVIILLFFFTSFYASSLAGDFALKSRDIHGQARSAIMLNGFGCDGQNLSPELSWSNVPEGTRSFAVTMYDPDAPTGSGWWHWLIFDISANNEGLEQNAGNISLDRAPKGSIQSRTDFGHPGYGGPCPPKAHGIHQYILTVYALDIGTLGLDENAMPALGGFYLNQHVLQKASIVFYCQR